MRAGELPGVPCRSGNGFPARRGRAGAPCCWSPRATRDPGPPRPLRTWARAAGGQGVGGRGGGAGRAARRSGPARVERTPSPRPRLPSSPRAGGRPERDNVSGACCRPPRRLSPRAPRAPRGPGGGWGAGPAPLRRPGMNGEPRRGGVGRG